MALFFVTSSEQKFMEAKTIIPELQLCNIEVPEMQEIDPEKILEAKLATARTKRKGSFVVEDTSLELECINNLPGPLIKWFLKALGKDGLATLAEKMGNTNATARCIVGYFDGKSTHFFEGSIRGTIVQPRGKSFFGWDPIFQPDGYTQTFAEITKEEKNKISHRSHAFHQLKEFIQK
jgi:inosine triphosphate pyrophosphatase